MDHVGVLKRAWNVTWRYKILWLFGLLAGGSGGGGGGGGGNTGWVQDVESMQSFPTSDMYRVGWWLQDNIGLIIALAALLVLVGLVLFILSVAAQGGLIHLVNEAEEGRPVRGMDGWAVGFRMWFRVFGIGFVLFVPYAILIGLVLFAALAPVITSAVRGGEYLPEAFLGLCGGLVAGGLLLIVLGLLISLLSTLATRHAVLDGSGVFASIGGAWQDVRVRFKDVFVMWLLVVAVGVGFAIVIAIMAAVVAFAVVALVFAEAYVAAGVVGAVLALALLVPAAIYGAFTSAIWTIFFRRLTGREVVETSALPGYTPPLTPGAPVPTQPAPPAEPAPPSAPYVPPPGAPPVAGAPAAPPPTGPPVAPPVEPPPSAPPGEVSPPVPPEDEE